jgi:excinuclease UvrABC ATPase subunit
MASVNQAHTVLTTKALRTRYVAELASGRSKCPACHGEGYTSKQRGFTKRENLRCTTCGGSGLHKER